MKKALRNRQQIAQLLRLLSFKGRKDYHYWRHPLTIKWLKDDVCKFGQQGLDTCSPNSIKGYSALVKDIHQLITDRSSMLHLTHENECGNLNTYYQNMCSSSNLSKFVKNHINVLLHYIKMIIFHIEHYNVLSFQNTFFSCLAN